MNAGRPLVSLLIVATLGTVGARLAWAAAQGTCMKAEGRMVLQRSTDGCASPVAVCLKGTVGGKGGFLEGATWLFTAADQKPSGSQVSYTGRTAITARTGTIITSTEGSLDAAAGTISLVDRVTAARVMEPRLMGAREIFEKGAGVLAVNGSGTLEGGFQADVSGEICLEK